MPTSEKTFQHERYRIVHQFGQDENFALYEAYDTALKTSVVLKEVRSGSKRAPTVQQGKIDLEFAAEVKLLTEIKHEHLLSIHDYFSEVDNHYLVMKLTDGSNLVEAIEKNKKPFSFLEAAQWADQLLDALSYLHKHVPPILHRHIAPQNITLSPNGKIKLLFSGSDKTLEVVSASKHPNLSETDFEAASFNYLPLEQIWKGLDAASQKVILNSYDERSIKILENPVDARSDIYALGASLYYAITGQPPIDALARSIDLLDGKSDPLLSPHKVNSSIPAEISGVLMRAMEIKRENRYDSAVIMRQILRTAFVKTNTAETKATELPKTTAPSAETKAAEQVKIEQERRLIEQNRLKIEAEQKRLAEERQLIQQKQREFEAAQKKQAETAREQLRQAEALRLQAEERAAEAERRLLEKQKRIVDESFELDDTEILELSAKASSPIVTISKQAVEPAAVQEISPASAINPVTNEISHVPALSAAEELFAVPQKNNNPFKYIAAAAVLLIVFGGAGWAIWNNFSQKPVVNTESAISQPIPPNDAAVPQSPAEPTPAPTVEETTQTNLETSTSSPTTESSTAVNNLSTPKNRTALPIVRKPVSSPAKPAANQKKAVTVDDIINDN